MEKLALQGILPPKDILRVYSGAYLGFYNCVEQAVEELFVGLVTGRVMHARKVRPLLTVKSDLAARRIIAAGRSYADWLPFDKNTRPRAKAFFVGGKPFLDVNNDDRGVLDRYSVIRNAIAHGSRYALARFQEEFVDGKSLPPQQKQPAGYLRGTHAGAQTRLEFIVTELTAVVRRLCA